MDKTATNELLNAVVPPSMEQAACYRYRPVAMTGAEIAARRNAAQADYRWEHGMGETSNSPVITMSPSLRFPLRVNKSDPETPKRANNQSEEVKRFSRLFQQAEKVPTKSPKKSPKKKGKSPATPKRKKVTIKVTPSKKPRADNVKMETDSDDSDVTVPK